MFYSDPHLQYPVRVDNPNPIFARMLQQALGGIEGEIRIMMQYLFQAWGFRGPAKYKDMLYNTGTEEISHVEMLATMIAMNLEGAPTSFKDEAASKSPTVAAILGGMDPRHFLSAGLAATASDSNGVPFNGSWVVASNNLVADLHANIEAEATGRLLVTRLWEMTDDPGQKDTLGFLISRDTMHQNQWLAVLEELEDKYPVPSDFSQSNETKQFSYQYFVVSNVPLPDHSRATEGPSMDGKGQFMMATDKPMGQIPMLAPAPVQAHSLIKPKNGNTSLSPKMPSPAQVADSPMGGIGINTNVDSSRANTGNGGGITSTIDNVVSKVTGNDKTTNP